VGAAAAFAVTGGSRVVTRFAVAEESMAPALHHGDYLVVVRSRGVPMRGDIVVFRHPGRVHFDLVKRVVALPGEHVEIADDRVLVDGEPLPEPWADGPTRPAGSWQLTDRELFLLGDNRPVSTDDSRELGPVPVEAVRWRARFRYWPQKRVGRVGVASSP
jgi:signal peptidase I